MAAVHGPRKRIVANVGAGGAPNKVFVVTEYVCIAAGVTDARRQVQVIPVIRLHAQLFGRCVCAGPTVIEIAEGGAATGIYESRGQQKGSTARLIRAGVERPSEVHGAPIGKFEQRILKRISDAIVTFVIG